MLKIPDLKWYKQEYYPCKLGCSSVWAQTVASGAVDFLLLNSITYQTRNWINERIHCVVMFSLPNRRLLTGECACRRFTKDTTKSPIRCLRHWMSLKNYN